MGGPTLKSISPLLPVKDLKASLLFYTGKLNFREYRRIEEGENKFAIIGRDGTEIFLAQKQAQVDLRNVTARAKPDGFADYDLRIHCEVGTLNALWKKCREANVEMSVGFKDGPVAGDNGTREFSIVDPDGYSLVFCEPIEDADTEKAKTDVWAFCEVIDRFDFETAKRLLAQNPALAKGMTEGGWTPLMSASRTRDVELVQNLLELGAKVNQRNLADAESGEGDNFALWFAANNKRPNRVEVAKLLVKHGAQVNAFGEFGETPLHQAAAWGNADIAEYLISEGANVNAEGIEGKTPLAVALEFDKNDVAEILRKHGAKEPAPPPRKTNEKAPQK